MRGRIAFADEEPLLLTFDGEVLLAFDAASLAQAWELRFDEPLAAIVFASRRALPRLDAGHPWRSPSSVSDALAVDRGGGIHAIDALAGRVVGSLPPVGPPLAIAACAAHDVFAVALADKVRLWVEGTTYDLALRATALAFSRDGARLAIGDAKGEVREVATATRSVELRLVVKGAVTDIAAHPSGEWLVATESALYHHPHHPVPATTKARTLVGGAIGVACAAKWLVCQESVEHIVICEWPATPLTRIDVAGRVVTDLAITPDRLAFTLQGGDVSVMMLERRALSSTTPRGARPWEVTVEDARRRPDRGANRFGVGALLTLMTLLVCMAYLSTSAKQSWVPPPPFLVTETCDAECEGKRVALVKESCAEEPSLACAADAEEAAAALEVSSCDEVAAALGRVHHRLGARDDGGHARLSARLSAADQGLASGCISPSDAKRKSQKP